MRNNRVSRFLRQILSEDKVYMFIACFVLIVAALKVVHGLQAQDPPPPPPLETGKEIVRVLDPTYEIACYVVRDTGSISCVKFTK